MRRVWADGKLIVNLSETRVQGKSFRYGEHVYRLHLGTETQAPDPVIEMHEDAGNIPAYRGLAYITFDELPLKDFGNRIPNITAEVVASASTVHPSQQLDLSSQGRRQLGQERLAHRSRTALHLQRLGRLAAQGHRVTGEVVYRADIASKPELVAWWDEQGWQGGPDPYAYAIDSVSGDLFLALNGLSRTTFARLDPDTLQLKSWYRQGLFTPGAMLVYAGRSGMRAGTTSAPVTSASTSRASPERAPPSSDSLPHAHSRCLPG
jgi:hypothetical protein